MSLCLDTIIEPARPTDVKACGAVMSDWVDESAWLPRIHNRAEERNFLQDLIGRGWVTVARRCGVPVGFIARDGAEIHALYLARAARGQGLGKALIDRAKAAEPALALWCFQSNEGAQRFYLREGFREQARTDGEGNDEHLPDIRYTWRRR